MLKTELKSFLDPSSFYIKSLQSKKTFIFTNLHYEHLALSLLDKQAVEKLMTDMTFLGGAGALNGTLSCFHVPLPEQMYLLAFIL